MDRFNHIAVTIFSATILVGALALLLAPMEAFSAGSQIIIKVGAIPRESLLWGITAVAGIDLMVLVLELWPQRKARLFKAQVGNLTVVYSPETVAEAVEKEVATIKGVQKAKAEVTGGGHEVVLHLSLTVDPSYDPMQVVAGTASGVRDLVERVLGLKLHRSMVSVESTHIAPAAADGPV